MKKIHMKQYIRTLMLAVALAPCFRRVIIWIKNRMIC